ncbi:outer membrane protein assembly factor BamA [Qipengyuania sp. JC766]|uniref:outer membrane protein assembly factor BamA n=1 Tax=Qipengyuania sp. JC766 TaxID=3232139 RepID=UPI003459E9D9
MDFDTLGPKGQGKSYRFALALLGSSALAGVPAVAWAQDEQAAEPVVQDDQTAEPVAQLGTQQQGQVIRQIAVSGAQRLEPSTIVSYVRLRPGQVYTAAAADQALKDLAATELFADYSIRNDNGNVVITVVENPVVNRIILEGNDRLDSDKILPEIRLAPRQIFTRSKVRADTARIIELYKRQGRFAASVEPQTVQLSQNRVDIVYEINEGPKSKVRSINIIGNEAFSDGKLRGEMVTKTAGGLLSFFSSNTSYDPDRLAFDQQQLRAFYLEQGYPEFRVVSAIAELTQDKEDFIITYVLEEGQRYKFGEVSVDSQIRDFSSVGLTSQLPMKTGDWYNGKQVEDTVEQLTELAGTFGYAFAEVNPQFTANPDTLTMDIEFTIEQAPRVYVERIDVNGNTLSQDKVIRREFRVSEGDAFNSLTVRRSTNRIKSLGYYQENFEIEQKPGSAPDRIVLEANVEEQPTGELQLSAGFSSIENFIFSGSIRQRNFRGRGQTVGLSANYSRFSRSVQASFTEPYLFDRNISLSSQIYRQDYNGFNFARGDRNTTFEQTTTGGAVRVGVPLTEFMSLVGSYTLNYDQVSLDEAQYFSDLDGDGTLECDPLRANRFLCDSIGNRLSSIVGATISYDGTDNRFRPTNGLSVSLTTEVAGLGGDTRYVRNVGRAAHYWNVFDDFIFSVKLEGGSIFSLENNDNPFVDDVRLTDRFFLGEPQIRGFDIRGVGPRILRRPIVADPDSPDPENPLPLVITDRDRIQDDALGGKSYYIGRAELEIPLGAGAAELGLRPSIWLDAGALFNVTRPQLIQNPLGNEIFRPLLDQNGNPVYFNGGDPDTNEDDQVIGIPVGDPIPDGFVAQGSTVPAFEEVFLGDSAKPRITAGIGVNWNSPFGPLRIDYAYVISKQEGDDDKAFSFNVGTQF